MDVVLLILVVLRLGAIFLVTFFGLSCVGDVLVYCCKPNVAVNDRQRQEVRAVAGKRALESFFLISVYTGCWMLIHKYLIVANLAVADNQTKLKRLLFFEKSLTFIIFTIITYQLCELIQNVIQYCQHIFRSHTTEEQQNHQRRQAKYSVVRCLSLMSAYSLIFVLVTNQTLLPYNNDNNNNNNNNNNNQPAVNTDSVNLKGSVPSSPSPPEETPKEEPQTPQTPAVVIEEPPPPEPEVLIQNNNGPFLEAVKGGVLPVRRFIIAGGSELEQKELESNLFTDCNDSCLSNTQCFAWEFNSESKICRLFTEGKYDDILSAKQSEDNDPNFVVGFIQKDANILQLQKKTSKDTPSLDTTKANKILYILNVPSEEVPSNLNQIVSDILPKSWMPDLMDLVVSTSRDYPLTVNGGTRVTTLRNPFCSKPDSSNRGSNSYMTLPIARARFPGYKGYLQVHYEAMLRLWEIPTSTWFGNRPWVIFQPLHPKEQEQEPRSFLKRYPYGTYGYSWYNFDSGFTGGKHVPVTRSNFDATLHAMKDLCSDAEKTRIGIPTSSPLVTNFCPKVSRNILSPFFPQSSPTHAFYVPNDDLGTAMTRSLTLFGEHDIFTEISLPTVQAAILPDKTILEMPFCDGSERTLGKEYSEEELKFKKFFHVISVPDGSNLDCPIVYPVPFEQDKAMQYWKTQIEEKCEPCKWDIEKDVQWSIVKE